MHSINAFSVCHIGLTHSDWHIGLMHPVWLIGLNKKTWIEKSNTDDDDDDNDDDDDDDNDDDDGTGRDWTGRDWTGPRNEIIRIPSGTPRLAGAHQPFKKPNTNCTRFTLQSTSFRWPLGATGLLACREYGKHSKTISMMTWMLTTNKRSVCSPNKACFDKFLLVFYRITYEN